MLLRIFFHRLEMTLPTNGGIRNRPLAKSSIAGGDQYLTATDGGIDHATGFLAVALDVQAGNLSEAHGL